MTDLQRRTFLAGAGASLLPLPALAAVPRSDPEWVRTLLVALHPGLYRYQSEAGFARRHAGFVQDWARTPTLEARYLALAAACRHPVRA